jgi:hypothetical protein
VNVARDQFEGLQTYRSSHFSSSVSCGMPKVLSCLDPPAALLQPMRLAPSSHGNSADFACLGAVFEIFGL